jgi:hypothetical protein
MTLFARHLSSDSMATLQPLRATFADWLTLPRATVHLRRGEAVALYLRGQRAMSLEGLGGAPSAVPFKGAALKSLDGLDAELASARKRIEEEAAERSTSLELDLQAGLGAAMRGDGEFVLLDEQVQVPAVALIDPAGPRTRVDLACVERSTGDVWLVEVKPARSADLASSVLEQLVRTLALPERLTGRTSAFLSTYRKVLAQRFKLGLCSGSPVTLSGRVKAVLVTIGRVEDARGRIACWPSLPEGLDDVVHAHLAPDEPLSLAACRSLEQTFDDALTQPRNAFAPRRPRWNKFTAEEDKAQAAWSTSHPQRHQLGPFHAELTAYMNDHHVRPHGHLNHPRSSQAACMQLFAPALQGEPGARQALAAVLDAAAGDGLKILEVEALDFEAPHPSCAPSDCGAHADMLALVGESGKVVTGLDVFLRARGERDGAEVVVWVAVEFKYTEVEFGCCGGFVSRGFDEAGKAACLDGSLDRRGQCYLLQRHGRAYLKDTDMFDESPLDSAEPCLLLGPVNQLYRGHFLAKAWADEHGGEALYVVVADGRNKNLHQGPLPLAGGGHGPAVDAYKAALRPDLRDAVFEIHAQAVVAGYRGGCSGGWLDALSDRYRW